MFLALIARFEEVQFVTDECNAEDIDADVIIVYDPHSSHHIRIKGLAKHKAVKYTYFDDPYQHGCLAKHKPTGKIVIKYGAKDRMLRAKKRGIQFIICPYTESYYKHLEPYNSDMELVWFPPCPNIGRFNNPPLKDRKKEVLANGSTKGLFGFKGYEFRRWAFVQPEVTYVLHYIKNRITPAGLDYPKLLIQYAGALALCDTHIPPKYIEIPMAGCVCFAQYQKDYERMGFKDGENCIYINKKNFKKVVEDFKNNISDYQQMATKGRKLVEEKWTADHFADFIYDHSRNNS